METYNKTVMIGEQRDAMVPWDIHSVRRHKTEQELSQCRKLAKTIGLCDMMS